MFLELEEYFRVQRLPHIWCPGCGHGLILKAFVMAMKELNINKDKTVIVSGIGCSSRASGYLDFNTLHSTHGRALAFATGIKFANPDLNVFVIMGDGDATAIGGNHLIHASRRNIDMTAIIFNNNIYGMTGGQFSPLTSQGKFATTAPYGNMERSFDICNLAISAGATFVGRGTSYHVKLLKDLIIKAYQHKGFSLVEALSGCPTAYGRKNKLRTSAEMLKWQRNHAVFASKSDKLSKEQMQDDFIIGELYSEEAPEYNDEYAKLLAKLNQEGNKDA